MRHQYTWGLVLASALAHVEGLPIMKLYKRSEKELKIYDHDGHPRTYQIISKATGGVSQAIHTIKGDDLHLAKGPVTLLEAMVTRWYTPETIIGSESEATAKSTDTGKIGESSATGAGKAAAGAASVPVKPGERNLDPKFKANVDRAAKQVHQAPNPAAAERLHGQLKGKSKEVDGKREYEWWMIMPIVGKPVRDLPTIKAALDAKDKPEKEKEKLVADCKAFVTSKVIPAVEAALDEWYTTIHAKSGHWFKFGDIKASHFRWESQSPLKARMIDFGTARIDTGNAKPTHEKINHQDWLNFCTPGYEDKSNTPSVKTSSRKSDSLNSDQVGHEAPESSAAGPHPHPHQGADTSNPTPDTRARQPTPPEPMRVGRSNPNRNSNGSSSSGCTCKDLMKCICGQ
ncbi:hypothetical protein FRC18_006551 [Serendipita sp. 400]|nr:hypothetical protein FRC18_006551 [Serendipita sp. 400]